MPMTTTHEQKKSPCRNTGIDIANYNVEMKLMHSTSAVEHNNDTTAIARLRKNDLAPTDFFLLLFIVVYPPQLFFGNTVRNVQRTYQNVMQCVGVKVTLDLAVTHCGNDT